MPAARLNLNFTLDQIHRAARELLKANPQPVLAYRLQHEVLKLSPEDPESARIKASALKSKWVCQLEAAQLHNGSWGRFHTQDTKLRTVFRTTEEAIDRAVALGLTASDPVLSRVKQYIEAVLTGRAQITDWFEKNDAFPVLIQHILAGRLAQIDVHNPLIDPYHSYVLEVAQQAFSSGSYRLEDEVEAYYRLSGIHIPRGFLVSQHSLWILSSRNLPSQLDRALVEWIWHNPGGIGYLGVPLVNPRPSPSGYWLRSMNLLDRFESWREVSVGAANLLWSQRGEEGLWDIPGRLSKSVDFPLSDSWRSALNRKLDYSTCVLALLRKYFD